MAVAFWRSKPFFDRCEIGLAVLAAVTAAIMQVTPADRKQGPASVVGISAVAIGLSKWRSKKIEETEKLAKASQELIDQEAWSKTIKALEHEKETDRQKAWDEIAKIRSGLDNQLKNAITILSTSIAIRQPTSSRPKGMNEMAFGFLHLRFRNRFFYIARPDSKTFGL
jgi:hypothetical protein